MLSLNQRAFLILSISTHPKTLSPISQSNDFQYSTLPQNILQFNQLGLLAFIPWLSAILAIISTQSILMLSEQKPLNVFFLLFILLIMPWLTYFLIQWIKYKVVKVLPDQHSNHALLLASCMKHIASESAFVFSLVSWGAIWLNLLLSDIPLGWSSSFSVSAEQLFTLASGISFLWGGLLESFTLDVAWFEQSQYFHLQPLGVNNPEQTAQGWRFIMLSLLVYSLLPRLIIYAINKFKLSSQLKKWIQLQWPILINQVNQPKDAPHKQKETVELTQQVFDINQYDQILSWQSKINSQSEIELGVHTWQHDLDIIQNIKTNKSIKNIAVVVNSTHAPVAELSDLLIVLKQNNPAKSIDLVILTSQKIREGQIYSWQVFAEDLNIKSYLTDAL